MIVHRPDEPLEPSEGGATGAFAVTCHKQHGDTLFAIPCARELARRRNRKCDFWLTPGHAGNLGDLLQAQSFVRHVVYDREQPLEKWGFSNAHGPGWGYPEVIDLGFRGGFDCPIPEYYCRLTGLPQQPNVLDLPEGYRGRNLPERPFVALASKGKYTTDYWPLFRAFAERCPHPVVEVGYPGETVGFDIPWCYDRTSKGFLEMAWILSKCRWFVGLPSSPYVVASFFDCVKVMCHDGIHWTQSHFLQTPRHYYPAFGYPPSADPGQILELLQ